MNKAFYALLICLITSPLLATSSEKGAESDPRLVLVIAVDQFRADYLDRFAPLFEGGLKTLRERGTVFTDAHQHHSVTATGPGHASVSTGFYPAHSGIVGNQWYEKNGSVRMYCVEDEASSLLSSDGVTGSRSAGRSPRNLLVSGLPGWMKRADEKSRIFGASRKDRASILMAGKEADGAFWYDSGSGEFISSRYYFDQLPEWLKEFNQQNIPARYFGKLWTPREVASDLKAEMGIELADFGWFPATFPHAIGSAAPTPNSGFYSSFGATPYMDLYLAELVKALIAGEGLGADSSADYLGVSFSACDSVGHTYGPNSPEILDLVLHLDLVLGELFEFVDREVGMEGVWIVLTADHGVMELPEYMQAKHGKGHRMDANDIRCIQNRGKDFLIRYGAEEEWFLNGFYLNYEAIGRNNLLRTAVEDSAAELLEECDFIQKIWTRSELRVPAEEYFHTLFRNSFHHLRSPDLMVQTPEYYLSSQGRGTSHGSPYRYDTHVPIVFMLPGGGASRVTERVETVDIAPTIADLLDLEVTEEPDGRSLRELLRLGIVSQSPRKDSRATAGEK